MWNGNPGILCEIANCTMDRANKVIQKIFRGCSDKLKKYKKDTAYLFVYIAVLVTLISIATYNVKYKISYIRFVIMFCWFYILRICCRRVCIVYYGDAVILFRGVDKHYMIVQIHTYTCI